MSLRLGLSLALGAKSHFGLERVPSICGGLKRKSKGTPPFVIILRGRWGPLKKRHPHFTPGTYSLFAYLSSFICRAMATKKPFVRTSRLFFTSQVLV